MRLDNSTELLRGFEPFGSGVNHRGLLSGSPGAAARG